ncbi:MAG: oligopeptide/dipeptide ABC transporter ATP-binding protein, partial [Halobacteriaceae archaeon]
TEALLQSIPRPDEDVEELNPIRGIMPEAIDPPSGCRFHPRCPDARTVCSKHTPEFKPVDEIGSHTVSCLKYESVGYEEAAVLESELDQDQTSLEGDVIREGQHE